MVKSLNLHCRGHGVEPRGDHNFCITHIGQSCAATCQPRIGPPHAHSASSQPLSHSPHCHITIRMPSQQYPSSDPYYHVSPCDWPVMYGCQVSSSEWCHVSSFGWSVHLPCHLVCTIRMPHVTLSVVPHHHVFTIRMPCVTLSVVPHGTSILPNLLVDLIKQNAVTFSYGVRLRRNECHWNCLNEPFNLALFLLGLEEFENLTFLDPPRS